jgi:hypothetical protein
MTDQPPSIRQDLETLAERYGPLEVAVIMAPEEFVAERGVRRLAGAWSLELGVVAMKGKRQTETDTIENIGDLTLVLTQQTATALHTFLTALLDPASRPKRGPAENLLPMIELPPEE